MAEKGFAVLWFQARGYEVDQSSYPPDNQGYILSGIENQETYVYREIVSHGLLGIDFLLTRKEVDPKRIAAAGASQGGGLSLILAGLDSRISYVSADFPSLCDFEATGLVSAGLLGEVRRYADSNPAVQEAVRSAVSYFDVVNFAGRIKVPVQINAGLLDAQCVPIGIWNAYRAIAGRKKTLQIYPAAGHGDQNAVRWDNMIEYLTERLSR
ncbi:MAG: acetylxylan esterase [Elusimicrobia bacterium]|nr:acetylxylan esterase [Elusimicrobiota bacterium]